jgi:phage baseplate assembly protein gpV
MDSLLNVLKMHASALDNSQARPRFALVTSVDPTTATARVTLQPENVLTGWLPILAPSTGAGWGIWCPPLPGDQVLVLAQEGDAEHGVIVGRAFSLTDPPPPAAAGELWLTHSSGSSVRLLNSGTIVMTGPVLVQGTVTVDGDVVVSGNVSDQHATLADLRAHYNIHTHTDSRGGTTSVPNPQD